MLPGHVSTLTTTIEAFLREIGLAVRTETVDGQTVLPGIRVEQGCLIYDPQRLAFPGDLLHEAGHLAVKSVAERQVADGRLESNPAEEMMAISWSYAAALHLGIPPEVVFHDSGYRGGSQSLLENFSEGRFLAVPMLQWLGMTQDEKRAAENGGAAFPKMIRWMREA